MFHHIKIFVSTTLTAQNTDTLPPAPINVPKVEDIKLAKK